MKLNGQNPQREEAIAYFSNRVLRIFTPDRFPLFYVTPLPLESLNSWLNRMAHSHYSNMKYYLKEKVDFNVNHNIDFDILQDRNLLEKIKLLVPYKSHQIFSMVFNMKDFDYYNSLVSRDFIPWLFRHKSEKSIHSSFGLQFCPNCWRKDNVAYFKLNWRLSLFFFCSECYHYLANKCPACGIAVSYIPFNFKDCYEDPLNTTMGCSECGFNLSKTSSNYLTIDDLNLAKRIEKIVLRKFELPCTTQDFLVILHFFTQRAFQEYTRIQSVKDYGSMVNQFKYLEIDSNIRSGFISEAFQVFENFPEISRHPIRRYKSNKPFWLRGFIDPPKWYVDQLDNI